MMRISPTQEQARQSDRVAGGRPVSAAAPDFELTFTRRAGGTTVLALAGELDLCRAPELERALAEVVEPDAAREGRGNGLVLPAFGGYVSERRVRRVVVDLRAVTFLESTTLALLLAASGRQQARGGELLILVGPDTPTAPFEVTGFDRLLSIRHARDRRAA
jgi:anti-anti-sigma regulatory factor